MATGRKTTQAHTSLKPEGHETERECKRGAGAKACNAKPQLRAERRPEAKRGARVKRTRRNHSKQTYPPQPNAPAGEPNISVKGLRAAESDEAAINTEN